MQGFMFTEEEMRVSPANDPQSSCIKCGLAEKCRSPYMKPYGNGNKKILVIGEWPKKAEDRAGVPMVGEGGRLLAKTLGKLGVSLDNDCWRTNAILCSPSGKPTNAQIKHCRKYLYQTIESLKPEKIIVLGVTAMQGLLGHRMSMTGISTYVGAAIPDQELGCTIFPIYDPGYILSFTENKAALLWFKRQIAGVFEAPDYEEHGYKKEFKIVESIKEIKKVLFKMSMSLVPVAFDYETTGIKPYNDGHELAYASVCNGGISYGFELVPEVMEAWDNFLKSPAKKIAHNLKFETKWSNIIRKTEVNNWYWDTMLAAHILDNRKGITSLKHQTYLNFGIKGYEDSIKQYLRATKEDEEEFGSNAINRIWEAPRKDVMEYCALDSKFTWHLYDKQKEEIPLHGFVEAFRFFMMSIFSMNELEENGITADRNFYVMNKKKLEERLAVLRKEVMSNKFVPDNFNPGSTIQVAKVLYDKMGLECKKETATGGRSTDNEALELTKSPWAMSLLEYRKLDKLIGTYMSGFLREISDDGKMHCNFNLNTVSTFRSSSSNPNFQNIPKRDKEAMNLTRGGLTAAPGHMLAELDFKGVEVSISACYHKDPNMIRYIEDPTTDMHRDMARKLFLKDDITKLERFSAKNGMTFAQFYGDYYGNCGPAIWEIIDKETKAGLKAKGLRNVTQFTNHVKTVEEWMWGEMFPDYARWKDENWAKYQKTGYVEYYTGFRAQGIMEKNFVNNCAIQGTAFHVLLWTLNYVVNRLHRLESFPMGQIHDSMILSIAPGEEEVILAIVQKALNTIRGLWKWIIVPLTIEYEKTPVNGSWTELAEAGGITSK